MMTQFSSFKSRCKRKNKSQVSADADDEILQRAICPSRHFCPADTTACLVKVRLRHGSWYYHLAQCLHSDYRGDDDQDEDDALLSWGWFCLFVCHNQSGEGIQESFGVEVGTRPDFKYTRRRGWGTSQASS